MTDRSPACSRPWLPRATLLFMLCCGLPWAGMSSAADSGLIAEQGSHYSLHVRYPVLPEPVAPAVNERIQALAADFAAEFLSSYREESAAGDLPGPGWALTVDYAPPYRTERLVAVAFEGDDYRGGAHGMPIIETLILDAATGQPLTPQQLFRPGARWLEALSEISYAELSQRDLMGPDDEWLRAGTAPESQNYRLLHPQPNGLEVRFPPYQVAPYAAGPQTVLIPYPRLAALLSPQWFPQP